MLDQIQDGVTDSSTVAEDEEIADNAAGGGQPEGDPDTGVPFSEHPRWKEVYPAYAALKAVGVNPEHVPGLLQELSYYRQLKEEAKAQAASGSPTEDEQELQAKIAEGQKALERLVPGISKLPQVLEKLELAERYGQEARKERAYEELGTIMKGAGMPTEQAHLDAMADHLVPIIKADRKLALLFDTDPAASVRKAWKKFVDEVVTPLSRSDRAATQTKGTSLSALPRAGQGGGGGTPAGKGTAPPQTIDELFKQHKGLLTG